MEVKPILRSEQLLSQDSHNVNKGLGLVSILSQIHPVHIPQSYFSKINHIYSQVPSVVYLRQVFPPRHCMHCSPKCATCPTHVILLHSTILIIFGEQYKLWGCKESDMNIQSLTSKSQPHLQVVLPVNLYRLKVKYIRRKLHPELAEC
jgi:hypothetical protein